MLRLPALQGIIRRRVLVNYRVDPDVAASHLPARLRPKLHNGHAVAGICLIHLEDIRPKPVPLSLGLDSQNAAHRFAVVWTEPDGQEREGVWIPRRDTNSPINHLLGGRVFPGEHHRAHFDARDTPTTTHIVLRSDDGQVTVEVDGTNAERLPPGSIFGSVEAASAFFEGGSLGYSATHDETRLDGIVLKTSEWHVEPLDITHVYSSYFAGPTFPPGSVQFDHALIMRNIRHEWHSADDMYI